MALTHLAMNLGRPYFAYLVTELQRMLGPKSEKETTANMQGFLRPVLIFTLHAMLNAILQQQSPDTDTVLSPVAEEASTIDGMQFIHKFEAAVPLLLPLIAEVNCRSCFSPLIQFVCIGTTVVRAFFIFS